MATKTQLQRALREALAAEGRGTKEELRRAFDYIWAIWNEEVLDNSGKWTSEEVEFYFDDIDAQIAQVSWEVSTDETATLIQWLTGYEDELISGDDGIDSRRKLDNMNKEQRRAELKAKIIELKTEIREIGEWMDRNFHDPDKVDLYGEQKSDMYDQLEELEKEYVALGGISENAQRAWLIAEAVDHMNNSNALYYKDWPSDWSAVNSPIDTEIHFSDPAALAQLEQTYLKQFKKYYQDGFNGLTRLNNPQVVNLIKEAAQKLNIKGTFKKTNAERDIWNFVDDKAVDKKAQDNENNAARAWLMNRVLETMNNEEAYYGSWLYTWPDGTNYEDCEALFSDQESFDDLEAAYLDAFTEYYEDGWYKLNAQADKRDIVNMIADTLRRLNIAGSLQEIGKDLHEVVSKATDARKYDVRGILREALRKYGLKFAQLENDANYNKVRAYVEKEYGEVAFDELYNYLEMYIDHHGTYGLDDRKAADKVIAEFVGDITITEDAGKFFVNYNSKESPSHAGPFATEAEARAALKKHRPRAKAKDEQDNVRFVITLRTRKEAQIIEGLLGQLSDGYWENSAAMEKYWVTMKVEGNNLIVKNSGSFLRKWLINPLMSVDQAKKWIAGKIKYLIKEEGLEWKRDNEEMTEWLNHHTDDAVTVREIYALYDWLMGRRARDEKVDVEAKYQYVKNHTRRKESYRSYIATDVKIHSLDLTDEQRKIAYLLHEDEAYGYGVRDDEGLNVYDVINRVIEETEMHNRELDMGFAGRSMGWLVLESWSPYWDEPYEYDTFAEAENKYDFSEEDVEHDYKLVKLFDDTVATIIAEYKRFIDEVAEQFPEEALQ